MSDVLVQSIKTLQQLEDHGLRNAVRSVNQVMHLMAPPRTVVLTGIGKSFIVAQLGASLFQSVGVMATAIHATDMLHGSLGFHFSGQGSTIVFISHSGETQELIDLMECVKSHSDAFVITVAVTGSIFSTLANQASIALPYEIDRDGSVHGTLPTVSVTAQVAWLNILACTRANTMSTEDLARNHPSGSLAKIYEEKAK